MDFYSDSMKYDSEVLNKGCVSVCKITLQFL